MWKMLVCVRAIVLSNINLFTFCTQFSASPIISSINMLVNFALLGLEGILGVFKIILRKN